MKTSSFLSTLAVGVTGAVAVNLATPLPEAHAFVAPSDNVWTYELSSHPDGNAADPLYGLRLDNLLGDGVNTFDFNYDHEKVGMWLDYDMDNDKIHIYGTAFGGVDAGNTYGDPAGFVDISFWYSGVTSLGGDTAAVYGKTGAGTITYRGEDGMTNGPTYDLRAKSNGNFSFKFDHGHRLTTDDLVGWGWLEYKLSGSEDDWTSGGTSDWLFTAEKVPEPSMTLGLLAIGGLMMSRRKRSQKA